MLANHGIHSVFVNIVNPSSGTYVKEPNLLYKITKKASVFSLEIT